MPRAAQLDPDFAPKTSQCHARSLRRSYEACWLRHSIERFNAPRPVGSSQNRSSICCALAAATSLRARLRQRPRSRRVASNSASSCSEASVGSPASMYRFSISFWRETQRSPAATRLSNCAKSNSVYAIAVPTLSVTPLFHAPLRCPCSRRLIPPANCYDTSISGALLSPLFPYTSYCCRETIPPPIASQLARTLNLTSDIARVSTLARTARMSES